MDHYIEILKDVRYSLGPLHESEYRFRVKFFNILKKCKPKTGIFVNEWTGVNNTTWLVAQINSAIKKQSFQQFQEKLYDNGAHRTFNILQEESHTCLPWG